MDSACIDIDPSNSCFVLANCPGVCVPIPPLFGCGGQLGIQWAQCFHQWEHYFHYGARFLYQ